MAVIVFDADDTLWMNGWQYDQAYAKFFDYILKIFGDKAPNFHYLYALWERPLKNFRALL